jgi:hypothetical protein
MAVLILQSQANPPFPNGDLKFWLPVSMGRVPISIRGLSVTIRGFDTNGSPLPYGDPDMGTGIDISSYMEMVNHRFHMGIEKFMIPVSIWGSPYGNGD